MEKEKQKQDQKRKRKKNRKWIPGILAIALAIVLLCISMIQVDNILITGNERFTQEKINADLFSGKEKERFVVLLWKQLTRQKKILPYLKDYTINLEDYHTVTVQVEEKEVFGCLDYGGVYLYIDVTGTVLDSSEEKIEGIPVLEGIYVRQAVLYEKIQSEQIPNLEKMEHILKLLRQRGIEPDILYYSRQGMIRIDAGTIRVFLGNHENLEEKINTLASILPEMEGLSGNLYLDEYNPQNPSAGYRFEKKQ